MNGYHLGRRNVVCAAEQLLYKLGSALTHGNGAESAVAGMAVRAEYHLSAAREALTHYRVNDSLMCGNVDSAVLLCGGETENMVVLVYRTADGAEAVMTVCEHVGYREFLQTARACRLNDADVCNVVRCHRVKTDAQIGRVLRYRRLVMRR